MSRQVDFAAGANTSRRVDLATRADTYRWVDFVAGAICLDRSTWPLESKCLGLTWLSELTSLQLELTSLDRSAWLPDPASLDKLTR